MITDKTQNANPDAQTIQPPAVMVYEISDPSVANEDFEILDQDVVHLGLKPFSARRVVESATLLIDEVLPQLPMRQWVLSVPFELRHAVYRLFFLFYVSGMKCTSAV